VADDVAARQVTVAVRSTVDVAHTWANQAMTRGSLIGKKKGATWPNHGLPRGTVLLVFVCNVKIWFWSFAGGSNRDLREAKD
jgi:hypothetical protein